MKLRFADCKNGTVVPDDAWRLKYLPRVVQLAKSILNGEISLDDGCYELAEIGKYNYGCFGGYHSGFEVFGTVRSQLQRECVPRGQWRREWDPAALAVKDRIRQNIVAQHESEVITACANLLRRFDTRRFFLMLEFEVKGFDDYVQFIEMEEALASQLSGLAEVDGHTSPPEQLYIHTDAPRMVGERCEEIIKQFKNIKLRTMSYRAVEQDSYVNL